MITFNSRARFEAYNFFKECWVDIPFWAFLAYAFEPKRYKVRVLYDTSNERILGSKGDI